MSCKMKIEQLKEAVAWGSEEVKSGESVCKILDVGHVMASAASLILLLLQIIDLQ